MLTLVAILTTIGLVHGGISPRITNGEDARIEDYPYQISMYNNSRFICGGSIINRTVILTAAHCTQPFLKSWLTIRAGSSINGEGGQLRTISEKHEHPDYNNKTYDNDIAVLILSEPLVLDDKVQIINFAVKDDQPTGSYATITGWGRTEDGQISKVLQQLEQQKMSYPYCKLRAFRFNWAKQICYKAEKGSSACSGDSGGPLVSYSGDYVQQVGVVSFGSTLCRGMYPTYYTKVSYFKDFIQKFV